MSTNIEHITKLVNIPVIYTDYFSLKDVEPVAFIDKEFLPLAHRENFYDEDSDELQEIEINSTRYLVNNWIEEDKYFILQLEEII